MSNSNMGKSISGSKRSPSSDSDQESLAEPHRLKKRWKDNEYDSAEKRRNFTENKDMSSDSEDCFMTLRKKKFLHHEK